MKIEILESLGYSYLRHVKQCWLVQANWKASKHWPKRMGDVELEAMFLAMKQRFDPDGKVFKQTKNAAQFLQQGEIDVLGVDQEGDVYAVETAFHQAGLNYSGETRTRVLKKLLRTVMIRRAYHPIETQFHICFASPKVHHGSQKPLEAVFADLQAEYPEIKWDLLTNEAFAEQMLGPTLEKASEVADESELFMRAKKLLDLAGTPQTGRGRSRSDLDTRNPRTKNGNLGTEHGRIQPLAQSLMTTLLEGYPPLLDETDLRNLMDRDYCKNILGLKIGNFSLLCEETDGQTRNRYYKELYGGRFYVSSQWGKTNHLSNARRLLQFVEELAQRKPEHLGMPALERSRKALREYVG